MTEPTMKLFKKFLEKIVINRYISIGLYWGDATSYLPIMGEAVGYKMMCTQLKFWETQYKKLGYEPINRRIWIDAGGYGCDYQSYLRMKKYD